MNKCYKPNLDYALAKRLGISNREKVECVWELCKYSSVYMYF